VLGAVVDQGHERVAARLHAALVDGILFNAISARHQRRSVVITTNLAFGEWPKVFGGDEKLTTALLDRLAESATIITTRGKSFRTRKRLAQPTPSAQP
jgi:DNA replication protein DnaC